MAMMRMHTLTEVVQCPVICGGPSLAAAVEASWPGRGVTFLPNGIRLVVDMIPLLVPERFPVSVKRSVH